MQNIELRGRKYMYRIEMQDLSTKKIFTRVTDSLYKIERLKKRCRYSKKVRIRAITKLT